MTFNAFLRGLVQTASAARIPAGFVNGFFQIQLIFHSVHPRTELAQTAQSDFKLTDA
jgi:hypothetical protein